MTFKDAGAQYPDDRFLQMYCSLGDHLFYLGILKRYEYYLIGSVVDIRVKEAIAALAAQYNARDKK